MNGGVGIDGEELVEGEDVDLFDGSGGPMRVNFGSIGEPFGEEVGGGDGFVEVLVIERPAGGVMEGKVLVAGGAVFNEKGTDFGGVGNTWGLFFWWGVGLLVLLITRWKECEKKRGNEPERAHAGG